MELTSGRVVKMDFYHSATCFKLKNKNIMKIHQEIVLNV